MIDSSKLPIGRVDVLDNKLSDIDTTIVNNYNETNIKIDNVNEDLLEIINGLTKRIQTLESQKHIVETWQSGTSWYRIWSDGWIEQGGKYTRASATNWSTTITLFKPYKNTNYNISISSAGLAGDKLGEHGENIENVTTTSFAYYFYTGASGDGTTSFYWVACGY